MELSQVLIQAQLGTLRLLRVSSDGTYEARAQRTWDPDLDWNTFNRSFDTDTLPCRDPRTLGDAAVRALIEEAGARDALDRVEAQLREGRHQMMVLRVEPRLQMRCALFVHSSTLGRGNDMHALRAGGFRRHPPGAPEGDVFADGANLARAMSYKNAAAHLPMGGCKITVQSEAIALDDAPRLGFLAYCIESGRILTGPDMGFDPGHADALRAFTHHCTGGREGPLGPTGFPTALGVFLAIREAARHAFGSPDLSGRTVAIQGVGAVGLPLSEHLLTAGARLVVADKDEAALQRAKTVLKDVEVVDPQQILTIPCDILAPCAAGGVLDEEVIDNLKCKMVFGAANNPLKASSQDEEIRLARRLHDRGVLFQIEWLHNTAGVMSGFEEYLRGNEATQDHLRPRLERVCKDGTAHVLSTAAARGITPTEVGYEQIEAQIYPEG